MDEMSRKRIEVLKLQYPKGCMVELVHMDDEQAPPKGTKGVVIQVDDIGTMHVAWETGSTLGVVPGIDMVRKPGEEIPRHKIQLIPMGGPSDLPHPLGERAELKD